MFFKIGVLKNFATVKHLCWSLFLIKLKKEEAPRQVFSCEYCEIFKNSFLYRTTTSGGCFCQFDKRAYCLVLGICRSSFINQKDLYVCAEHVLYILLIETTPTHFCWLTCRKQKLVQSKTSLQGLFVLSGFWRFKQVFVHYLSSILMTCK